MDKTIEADYIKRMEEKAFSPGAYVMLHTKCTMGKDRKKQPDAGRIGKITSLEEDSMVVEFFRDDLVNSSSFSLIPKQHWLPVPSFLVEEFEPRAKKNGYRINAEGERIFSSMKWDKTAATCGLA